MHELAQLFELHNSFLCHRMSNLHHFHVLYKVVFNLQQLCLLWLGLWRLWIVPQHMDHIEILNEVHPTHVELARHYF